MENKKFEPEDRLVKFAFKFLEVCDLLPGTQKDKTWNINYQKVQHHRH
jgi:hypothetical protein